jgi:hypothetical protein
VNYFRMMWFNRAHKITLDEVHHWSCSKVLFKSSSLWFRSYPHSLRYYYKWWTLKREIKTQKLTISIAGDFYKDIRFYLYSQASEFRSYPHSLRYYYKLWIIKREMKRQKLTISTAGASTAHSCGLHSLFTLQENLIFATVKIVVCNNWIKWSSMILCTPQKIREVKVNTSLHPLDICWRYFVILGVKSSNFGKQIIEELEAFDDMRKEWSPPTV